MREYRDELEAAQRRVATLEAELAEKRARDGSGARGKLVVLSIVVCVVAAIVGIVFFAFRTTPVRRGVVPAPVVVEQRPGPVRSGRDVQWIPLFWNGPITEDVNSDGSDDIIGLFWDDARPDHGAYLVAVGGPVFTSVIWSRGPFASARDPRQMWVRKAGTAVVFVDAGGTIRAFDQRTGESRGEWKNDLPIKEVCPLVDGVNVYLRSVAVDHGRMLDLDKSTLTPAPNRDATLGCTNHTDVPRCTQVKGPASEPCHPRAPVLGKTLKQAYLSYEDRLTGEIVTVGTTPADKYAPYFGVGAHRPGSAMDGPYEVAWEKRLSLPEEAGHERNFRHAFAKSRLLIAYQTPTGPYRVMARDALTGEVAWSHVLEHTAEASTLDSIKGARNRAYVVIDGRVVVFDAENGEVVTPSLQMITLPD